MNALEVIEVDGEGSEDAEEEFIQNQPIQQNNSAVTNFVSLTGYIKLINTCIIKNKSVV